MHEQGGDVLWTSAEAAAATGGRAVGRWIVNGVAIDSRELAPGDLFVALKDKRDGHEFVADAYGAGAAAALVERRHEEGPALVVSNTLDALRGLAAAARDRCPARRVAVTGSVGKTGVKEAIRAIFQAAGRAHASIRSFNNHWGAPLSLARMPRASDRAVFELGMSAPDEIRPLSHLVRPHVAIITKIAPAHLEQLGSLEAIADAKAEIFEGLEPWGAAVIPGDDAFAERLGERAGAAGAGWLTRFGTDSQAEARLTAYEVDDHGGRGEAVIFGRPVSFRVQASGAHWGLNATAALAAAYLADVPVELAAEALSAAPALAGRGEIFTAPVEGGVATVIDDAYNANPASMAAAIAALGARSVGAGGRRVAVLGEMRELGAESAALHKEMAQDLEAAKIDSVLVVGEAARPLYDTVPESRRLGFASDVDAAIPTVLAALRPGDAVLIKGSNAMRMAAMVTALKGNTA